MASQGLFSIGGIASGLDTSGIIEQLLALERQPVQRLERQQAELGRVKDAWGQVNTKLSSLRAATDKINRADRFDAFMSVTSSNPDAVSVSSSGKTDTGTLSFTVDQLARRMQSTSIDTFTSRDSGIDGRTLTITHADGVTHDLTAGLGPDATLDDLVAAVNDAGIGVRASALQVSAGQYQLVLDATDTGSDGAFTVDATGTTGWTNAFMTTQSAQDAVLQVGGIEVTRSSNTITDLVDGATITLNAPTTGPVTVSAQRDVDGAVKAVKGFTDALNGVITTIADLTEYDPESKKAGLLQGDASARRLVSSLRDAISRPLAGLSGTDSLASTMGISFDRTGALQFDEAAVRQAFTEDFEGTAARLGRSGTTTGEAGLFLSATSATTPGTYGVQVTQAAEVATVTGSAYTAPAAGTDRIIRIAQPSGAFTDVTLTDAHATAEDAAAHISAVLADAGVNAFDVTTDGGALAISTVAYGSNARFTVTEVDAAGNLLAGDAFGLAVGERTGVDVAGTIDGQLATGLGRTLTGAAGNVMGLSVRIDGEPADFDVSWTRGIAGQLGSVLSLAEGINGTVSRARQAVDRQVEIYQTRIDGFEQRLISREATIRRQFVGMETMLGQLNAQGNWLGQQLAGLSGGQTQ